MSEDTLSELLERTANKTTVGAAPIDSMLRRQARVTRRRRGWGAALVGATAVAVVGVFSALNGSTSNDSTGPSSASVSLDGTWAVTALVNADGQSLITQNYFGKLQITFDADTFSGTTGCNDINGTYEQSGDSFEATRIVTTDAGCGGEPPLAEWLTQVRHVSGSGDVRYLATQDGTLAIELSSAPASPEPSAIRELRPTLHGTWVLTGLNTPDGQSALPDDYGNDIEVTFDSGQVAVTLGCGASGTYTQSGDRSEDLRFSQLISTGMHCPGGPTADLRLDEVRHVSMYEERGQTVLQLHQENWMILAVLQPAEQAAGPADDPRPLEKATPATNPSDVAGFWQVTAMDTFRVPVDRDDRAAEFTGEWFAPTALSLIFTGDTWRLESGECQFMEGGYKFTGHEIRHVDPVRSSGSRCPDEDNTDIVNAANIMLRTRTIITSNDELRLLNERGDDLLAAQR